MPEFPATVIYDEKPISVTRPQTTGDDLWLTLEDLAAATGFEIKPEGVCRDDVCVAIPSGRADAFLRSAGGEMRFNLAEFARYLEQPVAHDATHSVWLFGEPPSAWQGRLNSLIAPDFTLPDLGGNLHTLSQFRGTKVALACWASW